MHRHDTEDTCHCGREYEGSDHCDYCGCEQYESGDCGETWCGHPDCFGSCYFDHREPTFVGAA